MQNLVCFDCEVYPNYFLISFKSLKTNQVYNVSCKNNNGKLLPSDIEKINKLFKEKNLFGFNIINYDIPVVLYAMSNKTCFEIFKFSKSIIENSNPGWKTIKEARLTIPKNWNYFDIMPIAPSKSGLKLYGARMHSSKLQDLPYDPLIELTDKQMDDVQLYCINDLDTTIDLYKTLEAQVELREQMSEQYGENMLSKSDAQIAEAIMKSKLNIASSSNDFKEGAKFKYVPPSFIQYDSKKLNGLLDIIKEIHFTVDATGSVKIPEKLEQYKININKAEYNLGIGGIHSCEKSKHHITDGTFRIIDKDVTSYYPSIIINCKLFPKRLGTKFLSVYSNIVRDRVKAKKAGNKVVDSSLKIVINGSFGKFGSKYSALYSPDLMIQVTLTGQLSLLMLIEKLEEHGIEVLSANTDGIVSKIPKGKEDLFELICFDWEFKTGFNLEGNEYSALYSRDVNNYLAITTSGKTKGKGMFTQDNLSKNPQGLISYEAVMEYLTKGIPLATTIKKCTDIRKFIHVRSVTGGAIHEGKYLGKVVRWIYVKNGSTITYVKNGNKVPKSDGALPVMEIYDNHKDFIGNKQLKNIPKDIDYDKYINESNAILKSLGLSIL